MAGIAILLVFCTAVLQAAPTIVEVRTAAPTVIVVVIQTDITYEPEGGTSPDSLNLTLANWRVDGVSPTAIHRYSIPWDELRVEWNPQASYPVTTRHRIYLRLSGALVEGHTYNITTPYGNTSFVFSARTTFCESIKVNQVGYSKLSTSRFANFGVYMGDGSSMAFNPLPTYQVINESSGAVVASGTAVYKRDDIGLNVTNSGEHVYRLSLNAVPEGGPYYVSVVGAGRSRSFGIGDAYSAQIANVTMRGMYLHRCGIALTQPYTPFTHAICHTNVYDVRSMSPQDEVDVPPGSPPMFIQGGYHDAGDMDHTEGHPVISILMLSFFEAFTNRFIDNQYNIPESGNGIPDFLDEIMWGVKMWEYLQIMNTSDQQYGGVRSGWSTHGYTGYGYEDAANDTHVYGTKNVQEDCTAMVAGIFAQASRLIRPYDATRANSLSNRAQLAWNYLVSHGNNVNQPKTRFLYAALQLYLATGNSTYHNIFQAAANSVILNGGGAVWPETYWPGNGESTCQTAHFISYLVPNGRSTDPTLVQNLKNKIVNFADTGTYQGPPPENEPYPQGVTRFLNYGAGTSQGRYADVWMYGTLFTTDPVKKQNYINAVSQYADFPLGLNPMGMSYYTGLGVDQPNSPLDCNSYYTKYGLSDGVTPDTHRDGAGNPIGNVPGIVVYGPYYEASGWGYARAVSQKMLPNWDNLPGLRRYAHGHTLVQANEFTVAETMAWNVPMYAFLYTPAGGGGGSPPATTAQRAGAPLTIDGNLSEAGWSITNAVTKTIIGTPNNTVTFGVLWDDTYLYVGAKVLDGNLFNDSPEIWYDDSIEIYIDGNHNRGSSYDGYDRQIVKGWNDGSFWVNGNQTNGIRHAWAAITSGYSVEVAIPWSNLGITAGSGTILGLDVANNDDDNGATRESQVMWAGTGNNWTDTSAFGDLTLSGGSPPPGGDEFTNDVNTIALYHFNGNYNDSSGHGYNLTAYGNVTRTSNPGWMQNPSGEAARFNDLGDQLVISTIPDSAVEPGPSQTPLSIEARIYVRGYKAYDRANAPIIELYQDWDARLELYDPIYPAAGQPIGPTVVGDTYTVIVTASQWQAAVPLNAWHKLKITFAADGTAKCYIDNNLIATVATSVLVARTNPWSFTLGNFDGDIDEVRVSNVVR
jgi:endoglucanase